MSSDSSYSNSSSIESDSSHQIYIKVDSEKISAKVEQKTSLLAVYRALFANLGIAGIKLTGWFFSRSSAMLSEAIHSGADSFNSLCLLVALQRGSKPADKEHPYGYGLEANVWAMFASILMFAGAIVSLYTGFSRFLYNHGEIIELLSHYNLTAFILIISALFEAWAISGASAAVLHEAGVKEDHRFKAFIKSLKYINQIKSPTTKFVWYEDTAAFTGVLVALVALTVSKFIVAESIAHIPDAIASVIIGLILLSLALYLVRNNANVLTGTSARPHVEQQIKEIAKKVRGVSLLHDLKTIDMGTSGLVVNMTIEVDPETQVKDADDIAEKLENEIKTKVNDVAHVTIEMQANDAEDDWEEKFEKLIKEGKKIGLLKPNEAKMLSRFFDFTDTVANEIMVPRTEVNFIDVEADISELIDLIIDKGHTRIPVYKDTVDDILGVVNAKDLLRALKDNNWDQNIDIKSLVREVPIVPINKSLSNMLNEFNMNKSQLALVVDEHGGVAGIVTVEDILEEIVGEIWDEFDVRVPEVIKIDDKKISIASKMDISDFNERFNFDLDDEEFNTIGGYVFGLLGREPEVDDEVESDGITFKIESMDGHKIVRVIVKSSENIIDKQTTEEI